MTDIHSVKSDIDYVEKFAAMSDTELCVELTGIIGTELRGDRSGHSITPEQLAVIPYRERGIEKTLAHLLSGEIGLTRNPLDSKNTPEINSARRLLAADYVSRLVGRSDLNG